MSGIYGICEPGREFAAGILPPMFLATVHSSNAEARTLSGPSIAFGVAQRWNFQRAAAVNGVSVVADADLIDTAPEHSLSGMPPATSETNPAEVIAHLYLAHGLDFVKLIHGAFSFALWDTRQQRLILAIDRMGIRSLYWRKEGEQLLFASRVAAIRAAQRTPAEANPTAILQYLLFSSVPAPLSSDLGTEKLQPGTLLRFAGGEVRIEQYWDLEYPESAGATVAQWANALREEMRTSVHRHLAGCDAPNTGCFLSGGTDSSSVVAFTSELHHPAQSFSIAFEEAGFSEIEFARTTAAAFRTRHHEKFLTAQDACDAVEKIIGFYDEPFGNSSAIGSYYCALLAREHGVDTLLAGDGGDELFGGNERYATDKRFALYHTLPGWLRHSVIEPLVRLLPNNETKVSLPRRYVRRANLPNPRRILSYGFFLSVPPEEIFDGDFLQQVGGNNWLAIPEDHFSRAKAASELNRILYLDVKMTLADNDLRKVCGTAELAGVRVRYPLLDDRLADFSGRIPATLKLRGFEKRFIFKHAMKGILPKKVLYKKKHGFGVPLARWLLQNAQMKELMGDLLHDSRTRQRGYFRSGFFEQLDRLHNQQPNYYGEIVWYLLALELWHRQHLEQRREIVHAL